MDAAHLLRLGLGEIVVDGDDVDALAGQRIEIGRQGGHEGLALTGFHLGDVAQVQRRPTHDLDIEVAFAQHAAARFADGGEGLRHDVLERLALGQPLLELLGLAAQFLVGHFLEVGLDEIDLVRHGLESANNPALAETEELVKNSHGFGSWRSSGAAVTAQSSQPQPS